MTGRVADTLFVQLRVVLYCLGILLLAGSAVLLSHAFGPFVADIALLLFSIGACLGVRQAVRQAVRERELIDHNARELEARVQARTAELTHALDELLESRRSVELANRSRGEFLARISQEIRTPMNGVLSMTELLRSSGLTPRQQQLAAVVHGSARSLIQIINDILDFTRIDASSTTQDSMNFNLAQLVEESLQAAGGAALEKGIEVALEVDAALPERVAADPARLRQILTNLVSNAAKFTASGRIEVRARSCGTPVTDGRIAVEFEVSDTGVGIPAALLPRMFESLSQAERYQSADAGGTGLGLAIVSRLVQLMGGEIRVSSEPGKGSTFTFKVMLTPVPAAPSEAASAGQLRRSGRRVLSAAPLPVAVLPAVDASSADANGEPIGDSTMLEAALDQVRGLCVLVVEDNPVNIQVATHVLEKLGCVVLVAENGREAIDVWTPKGFDLILMDCLMPEMDGYEATAEIRRREAASASGRRVPIVALTANVAEGEIQQALLAGMDDWIAKPFTIAQMEALLAKWRAGTASTSAAVAVPLLDTSALDRLSGGGSRSERRIAVQTYRRESIASLAALRFGAARGDVAGSTAALQALRDGAAAIGGRRFAQSCHGTIGKLQAAALGNGSTTDIVDPLVVAHRALVEALTAAYRDAEVAA